MKTSRTTQIKCTVLPPCFAQTSRSEPQRVPTYPGAVTGAPVAACADDSAVGARLRDHVQRSLTRPFSPAGLSVAYLFAYSSLRCLWVMGRSLLGNSPSVKREFEILFKKSSVSFTRSSRTEYPSGSKKQLIFGLRQRNRHGSRRNCRRGSLQRNLLDYRQKNLPWFLRRRSLRGCRRNSPHGSCRQNFHHGGGNCRRRMAVWSCHRL